jgi:hypothetical protein
VPIADICLDLSVIKLIVVLVVLVHVFCRPVEGRELRRTLRGDVLVPVLVGQIFLQRKKQSVHRVLVKEKRTRNFSIGFKMFCKMIGV